MSWARFKQTACVERLTWLVLCAVVWCTLAYPEQSLGEPERVVIQDVADDSCSSDTKEKLLSFSMLDPYHLLPTLGIAALSASVSRQSIRHARRLPHLGKGFPRVSRVSRFISIPAQYLDRWVPSERISPPGTVTRAFSNSQRFGIFYLLKPILEELIFRHGLQNLAYFAVATSTSLMLPQSISQFSAAMIASFSSALPFALAHGSSMERQYAMLVAGLGFALIHESSRHADDWWSASSCSHMLFNMLFQIEHFVRSQLSAAGR